MQTKSTRGVQQHEVNAAADALVAERLRPTIERIRQKIGRGSPNTVAPMLEGWFATLAPRLGVTTNYDGEGGAPPEVRNAIETLWRTALSLSLTQAMESLQSKRDALKQASQDLANGQAALEATRSQLSQQEAMQRDALSDAQAQTVDSKQRVLKLEAELVRANTELSQVRDSLGKTILERDADRRRFDAQLQASIQDREKLLERTTANDRRLLEEVDRARQETKQVRSEFTVASNKYGLALEELERTNQQLNLASGDLKVTNAALSEKLTATEQRVRDFQNALERSTSGSSHAVRKKPKPKPQRKS